MAERIYTMESLAEYLGVELRTIYEMTCRGKIAYFKVGKQNRFTQSQVDDYIASNTKKSMRDIKREAVKHCLQHPLPQI